MISNLPLKLFDRGLLSLCLRSSSSTFFLAMSGEQRRVASPRRTGRARPRSAASESTGSVSSEPLRAGEDDDDLLLDRLRHVLALLQDLDEARAAVELRARRGVEVGGELRERRHGAVLREVEAQRAGDRLHRLDLRAAADAAHRDADVDGRADARVEEIGLEEDLPVGDGDDVGRDVRRHVAGLRLDDRERGERAARVRILRELRSSAALGELLQRFGRLVLRFEAAVGLAVDAAGFRNDSPFFTTA